MNNNKHILKILANSSYFGIICAILLCHVSANASFDFFKKLHTINNHSTDCQTYVMCGGTPPDWT